MKSKILEVAGHPSRSEGMAGFVDKLVKEHGSSRQQDQARALEQEIDDIILRKEMDRIPRKLEQLQGLYYEVLFMVPAFWVKPIPAYREGKREND